jgi:hypothetical protein
MNFHPLTFLIGFALLAITAAGSLIHNKPTIVTSRPTSWNTTSVPLGTVYSVATNTPEKAYSWKTSDTLPSFTFADQTPSRPSNNLSDLRSYLEKTPTKNTAPIPVLDIRSFVTRNTAVQSSPLNTETDAQKNIHTYGNAAGTIVQSLESANINAHTDLTDFFTHPNTDTAEKVTTIGENLKQAGRALRAIGSVPADVQVANEELAAAYQKAGDSIIAVAALRTDADIVSALDIYNTHVENVGAAFVALVTLFKKQGIRFEDTEAGSAFVFTFSGAL